MKHFTLSLIALATIALTAQVFAADKPTSADTKTRPAASQAATPMPLKVVTPAPGGGNSPPPPPPPAIPTVTSAKFVSAEVNAIETVLFKLGGINLGAGKDCYGKVVWGDGTTFDNSLAQNGQWRTLNKVFTEPGNYTATVTPQSLSGAPCINVAPVTASIKVNPPTPLPPSSMTKLIVTPQVDPMKRLISTVWAGNNNPKAGCIYTLNFGDGKSESGASGVVQPGADTHHVYAGPGTYTASMTLIKPSYYNCSIGPGAAPVTFTVQ